MKHVHFSGAKLKKTQTLFAIPYTPPNGLARLPKAIERELFAQFGLKRV
jgi:hypothetical protein